MTAEHEENLFRQWLMEHKGLLSHVVRAYAVSVEQRDELRPRQLELKSLLATLKGP